MHAFHRMLFLAFVCLASVASAQSDDAAARVFGPHWKQLCRNSGMIFSGTVLEVRSARFGKPGQIPIIKVRLRVERPIVGVQPRRTITIREWAGAWSEHPLHPGERVLLLLYPESRLGLTSPAGGSLGQVTLSRENYVIPRVIVSERGNSVPFRHSQESEPDNSITLSQLEQAIRSARDGLHHGIVHRPVISVEE